MPHVSRAVVVCATLAMASVPAHAGKVTVDKMGIDEGNVTAFLEKTSQYYVDAMRELITDRYRDEYRVLRWEALESWMSQTTVARLEYHFTINGQPQVRVYHSQGGAPLGAVAQSIFEGPTPPGTPSSPDSPFEADDVVGPSPSQPAGSPDYAVVDAEDEVFFAGFDEANIRVRFIPGASSALDGFYVDGTDRALDPEFKALRAIEHDIQTHVVPRAGSVRGAIGGSTCSSCRHAMQRFAETYDVDVHITQMFGSLPRSEQHALIAAGKARLRGPLLIDSETSRPLLARDVLSGARDAQIRRSLSPRALQRSFKGLPWRQRSFRLRPLIQPFPRGEAGGASPAPPNADAAELPPPQC